jgi:CubicO group peptidase (beta-lactamase class C family)
MFCSGRWVRRAYGFLPAVLVLAAPWGMPAADGDAGKLSGVREVMQRFVDQQEIAGAVTIVGRHDRVLSLEAVGRRNVASDLPMQPDTLFRIASMTKPITAIGIMILQDEGKLSVNDPVEKHLPEFRGQMMIAARSGDTLTLKRPARPIRLRDLLTHTAGMPGMPPPGLAELYGRRNRTLAEGVLAYSQRPLEFEPGSRWAYSNTGIDTLGRIIEVVAGQGYEAFLKERIFDPLGMTDTTFYPSREQMQRDAVMYARKDNKLQTDSGSLIGPPQNAKYPVPAGGLYSTASDLARLYQMMLSGGTANGRRILSEAAVREMTQVQTGELPTGFTPGMGFGFGWGVVRKPQGVSEMLSVGSYGHGGAFGTQAWLDPHKDRFAVLLIQHVGLPNSDDSEMRREFQRVAFSAAGE